MKGNCYDITFVFGKSVSYCLKAISDLITA